MSHAALCRTVPRCRLGPGLPHGLGDGRRLCVWVASPSLASVRTDFCAENGWPTRRLIPHGNTNAFRLLGVSIQEYSSAILIDTFGRFLLQRRDTKAGVMYPGKISLFGGRQEAGESGLDCVVREIAEETSYSLGSERFCRLASLYAPGLNDIGGYVRAEIYVAVAVPANVL
nr:MULTISPECIES: NUDIX domain-containing protein [unclassified Bradyrhizobium]